MSTCPIYELRFCLIKWSQRFCHRSTKPKWFSQDVFWPFTDLSTLCLGFMKAYLSVDQSWVIFKWSCISWNNYFCHWWWSILGFFIATCSSLIGDLILVEFELWNSLFACTSLIITTYCLHSQNRCLDTLFMLIRCRFYFQFIHNDTENSFVFPYINDTMM